MLGLDNLYADKLCNILYQMRVDAGLTQFQVGEKLGVFYNFITKLERGDIQISLFDFIAFCNFFKLDSVEILKQLLSAIEKAQIKKNRSSIRKIIISYRKFQHIPS